MRSERIPHEDRAGGSRPRVLVEACVESAAEAVAAERGGAGRLELCARLDVGGTTPDDDLVADVCRTARIPVFVLVRARGGDFVFTPSELASMLEAIARLRAIGAGGIVTGALSSDGRIDEASLEQLVAAASPLPVTFHRAFDVARHAESVDVLVAHGVERILTSGGGDRAIDAADAIRATVERARGRIGIVACGGVRAEHAARLVRSTGVQEVHARVARLAAVRLPPAD